MAHKTRSARTANAARRARAAHAQRPMPLEVQQEVAAERAAAHARRYPVPPLYRRSYDRPEPTQPVCYTYDRLAQK